MRRMRYIIDKKTTSTNKELNSIRKFYKKISNEQIIMVALRSILNELNEHLRPTYNKDHEQDISEELWRRIQEKE